MVKAKAKKKKAKPVKAKKPKKAEAKKPAKAKKEKAAEKSEGKVIGKVTHFFDQISVAVVELKGALNKGDKIKIKGATTDFEQKVESMQIEHDKVDKAKKGDAIGLKVADRVRPNDTVYIV